MRSRKTAFPRRGFMVSAGVAATVAALSRPGQSEAAATETTPAEPRDEGRIPAMSSPAQADVVHFRPDGGINDAHLVNQLAGHGQSIDGLAFITSAPGGNLELLGRGGTAPS